MKCLIFCACERVIIDQQGNPSLIMLIENLNVNIQGDDEAEPIPVNVIAPKEWAVFSLFVPDAEDIGKTFQQRVEFVTPDHNVPLKSTLRFTIAKDEQARNIQQFMGFPVGQQGSCEVRMWVEDAERPVTPTYTYRVNVTYVKDTPSSVPAVGAGPLLHE